MNRLIEISYNGPFINTSTAPISYSKTVRNIVLNNLAQVSTDNCQNSCNVQTSESTKDMNDD